MTALAPAAFVRAQLDEDEQAAQAAASERGGGEWTAALDPEDMTSVTGRYEAGDPAGWRALPVIVDPDEHATSVHIARQDPARVLRRISADRRTLKLHDRAHECSVYDEHTHEVDGYRFILDGETCTTVWLLAEAYGHPDVPKCGVTAVFWPDDEACDAVCMLPVLHEGQHEDEILGEWED